MPDVLVEVKGSWIGNQKKNFLHAIHQALLISLKTDPDDKVVRLVEHPLENFLIPNNRNAKFTRIEIALFSGRSVEIKRKLYTTMVKALAPFGIPAEDIKIVLIEVPMENVGTRGGQAACDIELSYEINI